MSEPSGRTIKSASKFSADGFTVLDSNTREVLDWGYWMPMFLPKTTEIPSPGRRLVLNGPIIDLEQVDTNGRLIAVSLASLGDLRWLCVVAVAVFILSTLVARYLSRKFLVGSRSGAVFLRSRLPGAPRFLWEWTH
jgi:hypothetical protein